MEKKEIAEEIKKQPYFETVPSLPEQEDDGTRDIGELYPFLICGGKNTERYYFMHINDITNYKFNIRPEYFGDESNYTESFPKKIKEILKTNNDAKIFCVLDWDTIYGNEPMVTKHEAFETQLQTEISKGIVTICPSMPSIEYWFLLHFVDYKILLKNYQKVSGLLAPYIKPYFPNPKKPLKKLIKKAEYLKDSIWVEKLCEDGKLTLAIERAEANINAAVVAGELENQSYSYIYKVFKER
jgi:hypothetical protein